MIPKLKSIRPFVGAQNFEISRNFYRDLEFEEVVLESKLSLFIREEIGFYLQDYYTKDWIDNTMIFMEVANTDEFWKDLVSLELTDKYENVRLTPVRVMDWGKNVLYMIHQGYCGILVSFLRKKYDLRI